MDPLPKEKKIYCNKVEKDVLCTLTPNQDPFCTGVYHDAYICTNIGTRGKCNPCSHYTCGTFVPVPESVVNEDGGLDFDKWADALHATVSVPLTTMRNLHKTVY